MKTQWMIALLVVVTVVSSQSKAQEMPTAAPEHAVLMQDVGEWSIEGEMLMEEGFEKFKAEETVVAVGDFWTVSHYSADMFGGMKGSATMGYDPSSKSYVGSWVDSVQPSATHMKGTFDKESKTMTFETSGMGMDGNPVAGKIVVQYHDENSHTFSMMQQDPTGQTEDMVTVMKMVYTRK